MWFATDDGLNKYDGYNFTVYRNDPQVATSISFNSIFDLTQDTQGNLLVLTPNGLDRYDYKKETFVHLLKNTPAYSLTRILVDSKGRFWLGGLNGLALFDPVKKHIDLYKSRVGDTNSLSHDYIYRIIEDVSGKLWIATRNGVNLFDPESGKFTRYQHQPGNDKSIGYGYVKTLYRDRNDNIWIGTQGSGVALYDRKNNSFINFRHNPLNKKTVSHNDILSFAEDGDGRLWVGTENGGISVMQPGTNQFDNYQYDETDEYSLSNNSVYSLYKDDVGNMWVGTWSGGINLLARHGDKFRHYNKIPYKENSLSNNQVLSITADAAGKIWIGTDGGGLNYFDPVTHNFKAYKKDEKNTNGIFNDYVLSVCEFQPGVMALGFHRGGFDLFDVKKNKFTHYVPKDSNQNRLTAPSIINTYRDKKGNLWLGAADDCGLYKWNNDYSGFTRFLPDVDNPNSFAGSVTYSLYESKSGELWVGGDKGLNLFNQDKNTFTHYQHDADNNASLSNNFVYSITEDSLGNLWIGTANGINYFNRKTNTFTSYTEKDGLVNNLVCGSLIDRHGDVWITTNNGISRFNPATKVFKNYGVNDGLQGSSFKTKACVQTANGEMFVGGLNGFNAFFPDSIRDNTFIPPVYLTGFQVFNKPVAIGEETVLKESINEIKEISLSYTQSVFTIGFAALNFFHPDQNLYQYKLEGFDKEWIDAGHNRSATYTNLDPGTYTFKVKGSNNDAVWNEKATMLKITITPPFWLTWWFISALVLLATAGTVALYKSRIRREKKLQVILQQKVDEQTKQLVHLVQEEQNARHLAEVAKTEAELANQKATGANQELQIKNKELEQFAYVASHDLQEPLRTTTSFVNLLQKRYKGKFDESAEKYFAYITDASDRMKNLIRDLLEFSRIGTHTTLQKVDCGIIMKNVLADINVAITEANAKITCGDLPIMSGYETEIKMLFQNLLINAIKFRRKNIATEINVSVTRNGNYWQFAFADNGIGIEKKFNERIFIIFQRLHTRVEYEGSGIGLSHCKKIVELHHGEMWVDSIPGHGSTFYFTLLDARNL